MKKIDVYITLIIKNLNKNKKSNIYLMIYNIWILVIIKVIISKKKKKNIIIIKKQ